MQSVTNAINDLQRTGNDGVDLILQNQFAFIRVHSRLVPFVGFNQSRELLEEIGCVVGAGGGFGVVLDAEDRVGFVAHAFDRLVVEVDVGDFDFGRERIGVDREAVVLRSDGNLSGAEVLDRLVAAAVAEFQFEGAAAVGVGEELVAEADAEDRFFADELAEFAVDVAERGRVAGAVGEEDAVGIFGEDFGGAGGGVHHFDFEARLAQAA